MCKPVSIGFVWLFVSLKEVIADHTINASIDTQTIVTCTLAATLPLWEGPPSFTTYLFADSPIVNPTLSHSDRLAVADGNLIINNTALTDDGDYKCSYVGQGSEIITVIVGCSLLDPPDRGAVNTTFGVPGDVATYQCDDSYTLIGQITTTCQTNGSWSFPKPLCQGSTTTTTTTTTITSPTTVLVSSSTNATTTSSVTTSRNSISTSTTSTMAKSTVTSTKITVQATSTSRGTVTRTGPPITTSVIPVSDRDSDKAIVTMIIVVSVIGGILIVAIFSILFVMMHWKSCFNRRGHSNQNAQRSDNRIHHRRAEYLTSGRYLIPRQDHAMRGYCFYNGTYKNPLFCDPFENSSYFSNSYPNQKNSHDPKYMISMKPYQYNFDGDYNWDLKDNY